MSSKKWFFAFIGCILTLTLLIAGLNILVDPFGVFGDPIMNWHSFNFTNNPRAAKIAYLDKHHAEYDSYIIGGSTSSAYSVDKLNSYMDAKFFNLFMYGCDLYDVTKTVEYITAHYSVKNIVIPIGLRETQNYQADNEKLTDRLHAKVDESPLFTFYLQYMFANPKYMLSKLSSYPKQGFMPEKYNVFIEKTGAYNKVGRDVEPVGDLDEYFANYPDFGRYVYTKQSMTRLDECLQSIAKIKDICDANGINLTVIFSPEFYLQLDSFIEGDLNELWSGLADITGFWDFSFSQASTDARYFYDVTHIRNALGDMILARIYNDKSVYIPEGFGVYVTKENAADRVKTFRNEIAQEADNSAAVPILLYHHFAQEVSDAATTVTPQLFESHVKALQEAGFTTISFDELIAFVEKGIPLPQKPIIITMDDGYTSNYAEAFPILQQYNAKATIFIIGSSVGKNTYKDTENPIIPHFSYQEAHEMVKSGLISIQSHSYDLHQYQPYEGQTARVGVVALPRESEEAFIGVIRSDYNLSRSEIESEIGVPSLVFSYPFGKSSNLTDAVLSTMGVKATLVTAPHSNTVVKGLPQSLFGLGRFNITNDMTPDDVLALVNG